MVDDRLSILRKVLETPTARVTSFNPIQLQSKSFIHINNMEKQAQ